MDATALEGGCILGGILGWWISICCFEYVCIIVIGPTYLRNCAVVEGLEGEIREFKELKSSEAD
jgi:hypothetical protein